MARIGINDSKIKRKMVAKISSGKSVFGVLNYNKIKVDKEEAKVLHSQKMFISSDGSVSLRDCMDSFYSYLMANKKTENVAFHASINPDSKDQLSDEQLSSLCQEYMEQMGYGNQPYVVFLHQDIQRKHAHIVSLRIDENGKKISDQFEKKRSMTICRELEIKHNLHPANKKQRSEEPPTKKIDYKTGDIKYQIGNIAKSIMDNYHFQSFGEYRTLLEMFNLTVEEVKGDHKNKSYQGLIYSVIDENGEKMSCPLKASLFGKSIGYQALQQKFEKSKFVIEQSNIKNSLRSVITKEMQQTNNHEDFKQRLLQSGIGCVFRKNEQGRIYGVSFIDYQNKTILNGSRIGKEFSANIFNELFKDSPKRNIEQSTQCISQSAESVGIRRFADDSIIIPNLFEQHGTDWDSERFADEKKKEEEIRRKKNQGWKI